MTQDNPPRIVISLDPRRSLRARVGLTFGSLIILLALLLSYFIERPAQAQLEQDIGNNLASLALRIAEQLDQAVVARGQELELLASLPTLRDRGVPASEKQAVLDEARQIHAAYAWLGLVNPAGTITVSSGLLPAGLDVSEREWFRQGQEGFYVADTREPPLEDEANVRLLVLALPTVSATGTANGVIGAYLNRQWAQETGSAWLATAPNPAGIDLFIVSADGHLLYGSTAPEVDWPDLVSRVKGHPVEYGYGSEQWEEEELYLTGYAHTGEGGTGWLVLLRQNRQAAFAPVRRLQQQVVLWGVGLGLLFLVLGWFLAGRIVRPLSRIAAAAERIRSGDIHAEFPDGKGRGELAIVAHSLHTMVDTLQAQQAALAHNQELLEQRVHARTRTLTALYQVLEVANVAEDLPGALEQALAAVLAAAGGEAACLHLVDRGVLTLTAQQGLPDDVVTAWRQGSGDDLPATVLRLGKTVTASEGVWGTVASFAAYVGVPVRSAGKVQGVLSVLGREQEQFVEDAVALLESVADEFGVIVENARLQQRAEQLAVLEERNRLARELHDSVTQSLYSLTLFAEAGRRMLAEGDLDAATEFFGDVGETSQQALKEMRLLLHKLRPAALQQEGLVRALRQRLNAVEERSGIANELVIEGAASLAPEVEEALYHIATEALNNALRHAQADRVRVVLRNQGEELVELQVSDNGQGFDPALALESGGMGVANMHERAHHAGGELVVESMPGQGTTVRVRLPK